MPLIGTKATSTPRTTGVDPARVARVIEATRACLDHVADAVLAGMHGGDSLDAKAADLDRSRPPRSAVTSPPLRSRASSTMPAGATSGAPIVRSVSASRWSVWPCVESTTSTNASRSGATTRGSSGRAASRCPRTSRSASRRGRDRRAGAGPRDRGGSRSARATRVRRASTSRDASSRGGSITARRGRSGRRRRGSRASASPPSAPSG